MVKFISNTEYDRLVRLAERGGDLKKLEKKYNKQVEKLRISFEERLEDNDDANELIVRNLERQLEKTNTTSKNLEKVLRAEFKETIDEIASVHAKEMARLKHTINEKEEVIKSQKDNLATQSELTLREKNLKEEIDELERTADFVARRTEEVEKGEKDLKARVKDQSDQFYKSGYTDGVSDTLRSRDEEVNKAHENVFELAKVALGKETTVIATTQTPQKQGK